MRKLFLPIFFLLIISCDRIRGWYPGWNDKPPTTTEQNSNGCNRDVNVHYKNNCSKELIIYFSEVNQGTTLNCESLVDYGMIDANQTKTFIVHKGKHGYFVFAEDPQGKCTGGHRKAEYWISCEQSTSADVYLDVCH